MSIIDFTKKSCKNKDILDKQITQNFEEHFAMYSFSNIKDIPNIEVLSGENAYIVKTNKKKCKEIIDSLSSYKCSHFDNTLTPVFTILDDGLKIEFKIDGE